MKRLISFSLILIALTVYSGKLSAANYTADDQKIDQMLVNAPEKVNPAFTAMLPTSGMEVAASEKTAPIALVLDFFLGGLGVHRFYLGTATMTGIGYILTCGGIFGIVPLVDFIVLIINMDDISQYINNPKFFMWN
jgi:TM2 domain-containing membrane protein YozV